MKKKRICLYYSILMLICQCFWGVSVVNATENDIVSETSSLLSSGMRATVVDHCDAIRESLKTVQKKDRQTRVYLGRIYETILNKFVTPLNLRLVENNMPNQDLLNNQSKFAEKRALFMSDYVSYQQVLEETILIDCKNEPEKFYEKLSLARDRRKAVSRDVARLRDLVTEQIKIVTKIRSGM